MNGGIFQIVRAQQAPAFLERLPSLDDVQAARAHRSLFHFFRLSWKEVEPTQKLVLNWHLEAICDHVQTALEDWIKVQDDKTYEQRIKNLLVNVPPGSSKSRIVSVCAPAWMWLHWPSWRVMCLSSNPDISTRDALWNRDIITSAWYNRLFEPDWTLRDDQSGKTNFWTTAGGWRKSAGWFAQVVGSRHDCLILDDPHDPDQARSEVTRKAVIEKYDQSIANRVTSFHALRLVAAQQVAADDFSNHVLAKGNWVHLSLPQEFEPARLSDDPDITKQEIPRVSPIGWSDPRTQAGELLDPVRHPVEELDEAKIDLGSFGYAAQHQQRAAPRVGGIWKRFWWGYWVPAGIELEPVRELLEDGTVVFCRQTVLPPFFEWSTQSWDMAFGGGETSSMVVGQVGAVLGVSRFFLDQVRGQMDFLETQSALRALSFVWPRVEMKLVENKANGPAIISSLQAEIPGLTAIEPEGDKTARAAAEEGTIEAGRVFLPHPGLFALSDESMAFLLKTRPEIHAMIVRGKLDLAAQIEHAARKRSRAKPKIWVEAFVDEAANFPNGAFKDIVDTGSQWLNRARHYIQVRDANSLIPHSRAGRAA